MKRLVAVLALLALGLPVAGCGGGSTTTTAATTASGTWQAVLSGGSGDASGLSFITTFTVNGDNSLNVTGIEFITAGPCFVSGASASGTLTATTGAGNVVMGPLSLTVVSGSPSGNTLTLTGTETGSKITGTWTLTGSSDCTFPVDMNPPSSFTMCQGSGTCTPAT